MIFIQVGLLKVDFKLEFLIGINTLKRSLLALHYILLILSIIDNFEIFLIYL